MKNQIKSALKAIIKQTLLTEMDLQGMVNFSKFDDQVRNRMLKQINPLKESDPEKYQELQKQIEKDVVDLILSRLGGESSSDVTLLPAARNSAERAKMAPRED